MFINTKTEAKIAARIAAKFGFTRLTSESFYKCYTTNVFAPWSNENDARSAMNAIAEALRAARAR